MSGKHLTSPETLALKTVRLVPIRDKYAEYIYSLRINPALNTHLSSAPPSVEAQAAWIRKYIEREQAGEEFYFLIERLDGIACGTVRLYDFRDDSFCWGSWILDASKTRFAAIESALLVYQAGFEQLGFTASHFDVRKQNEKVISFHRKFGAQTVGEDEENFYFQLPRAEFEIVKPQLMSLINRG